VSPDGTVRTVTARTIPFADLAPTTTEIRDEVEDGWRRLLDGNAWVGGEPVERFERGWAAYCGTAEAVAVANGTDALHLILRALGIGAGDEVLVPANTFIATAEAVVLAGARPRFVDVDPTSLLMTAETVEAALTPSTAAIVPVHLFGHVADLRGLREVARRHGLAMVEDAAQAQGAERDGVRVGSGAVAAGFSFYPGKNLGAFGDAGAVTTDDVALAAAIRSMANHGRAGDDKYLHTSVGTNSRLDSLQAVVLSAKLSRLDTWTDQRRKIVEVYRPRLAELPARLVEPDAGVDSAWHLLVVRVPDRDAVRAELAARGVQTGIHYPVPCSEQPAYAAWADGPLPVAGAAAREILSLPLHPHMDLEDVDVVCDALADVLGSHVEVPR
jgi:dTDP-4-amino-4,6-dideoxygalactose transaminase